MRPLQLFVLVALLSIAGAGSAQVRKCTGLDGKVTYSDFICGAKTAKEDAVTTHANTVDASGLREKAQTMRTDDAIQNAMARESGQCKFSYFAVGDTKGKALAAAAKQECLDNIAAKASGRPGSTQAYAMWKDHSSAKTTERNNAAAQSRPTNCDTSGRITGAGNGVATYSGSTTCY